MAVLAVLYGARRPRQRLVPDQPARRRRLGDAHATPPRAALLAVQRRRLRAGARHPRACSRSWSACSTARCCRCSRGIRPSGRPRRARCCGPGSSRGARDRQPALERAHRLAVVRRLPDRVRPRRGPWSSRARRAIADLRSTRRSRPARGHRDAGRSMRSRVLAAARVVAVARAAATGCPGRPSAGRPSDAPVAGHGLRDRSTPRTAPAVTAPTGQPGAAVGARRSRLSGDRRRRDARGA